MPILRILRKIFEYFYRRNIKKLQAQTELINDLSLRIDEIKKYFPDCFIIQVPLSEEKF